MLKLLFYNQICNFGGEVQRSGSTPFHHKCLKVEQELVSILKNIGSPTPFINSSVTILVHNNNNTNSYSTKHISYYLLVVPLSI